MEKEWTKAEIQQEAEKILEMYAGRKYPVQIVSLAEKMGLRVYRCFFDREGVSGMIKAKKKEIFVYNNDSARIRRFSIARELGYYVLHYQSGELQGKDSEKYVSYRENTPYSLVFDKKEIEANFFASNLLMPELEVRRLHNHFYTLEEMADYFNVSKPSMGHRLKELDLDDE